jgi:hypothetical protein
MLTLFAAKMSGAGEVKGFVEGDDGLFTFQFQDKAPTVADYARLGFTIKVESTTNLNEASFCGNVFDTIDKVVLTDPMKAIAGFGWTNKKYVHAKRSTKLALLRAKALSLVHQYNGVPMLSALGRRVEHLTRGVNISKRIIDNHDQFHREQMRQHVEAALPVCRDPTVQTRNLVEKLYGITVRSQLVFERAMESLELDSAIAMEGYPRESTHEWFWDNYCGPKQRIAILAQSNNRDREPMIRRICASYTKFTPEDLIALRNQGVSRAQLRK